MPHVEHVPDRTIVAQLKRIDKDLSVDWVELPDGTGRWGVFHDLQVEGNFEESVERVARAVQATASENGHVWDMPHCSYLARQAVKDSKLVCYVTDDDGGYRSLDGRIVQKLERMDFYRRNLGVLGWKDMIRVKAEAARARRERDQEDVWNEVRKDKVLAAQVSDVLWGLKPMRSVYVKGVEFNGHEAGERAAAPADVSGQGAEAAGVRGH